MSPRSGTTSRTWTGSASRSGRWSALLKLASSLIGHPPSGDAGADMIVHSPTQRDRGAIVQVKHRSSGKLGRVSEREVIDVLRARERYPIKNPFMVLVTTGSVEPSGHAIARVHEITVVDYSTLGRVGDVIRSELYEGMNA
ncbi:restriction endonuclease [Microvirga guangxiensis]|nr:restriction endonuclease [Microvirga guangxiensis]